MQLQLGFCWADNQLVVVSNPSDQSTENLQVGNFYHLNCGYIMLHHPNVQVTMGMLEWTTDDCPVAAGSSLQLSARNPPRPKRKPQVATLGELRLGMVDDG